MYAALARAVLDETGARPRRRTSSGSRRHPRASRDELAERLIRRTALQCAGAGALLTGPAAFFGAMPFGADLAWQVVALNRLVLGLAALYGRAPSARDRAAGVAAAAGAGIRIGGDPAGARPGAAPGGAAAFGRADGARCARGRGSGLRRGPRDRPLRESRCFAAGGSSRRSAGPCDDTRRRRGRRRRRADRTRPRGGARGSRPRGRRGRARRAGREASGAAAGMLSPQTDAAEPSPFFDLALESRSLYPDWSRRLLEEIGIDVGYRRTGLLRVRLGPRAPAAARACCAWQRARGLAVEERTRESLEPGLAERLAPERAGRSCSIPTRRWSIRGVSRGPRGSLAERRGVRVLTSTAVRRFSVERGACRGSRDGRRADREPGVVDAAGAWAAFDREPPDSGPGRAGARPDRRGAAAGPTPRDRAFQRRRSIVVPRPDGTARPDRLDPRARRTSKRRSPPGPSNGCSRRPRASAREIAAARFVTAWAGLRPETPDGWPLLGGIAGRRALLRDGPLPQRDPARARDRPAHGRPPDRTAGAPALALLRRPVRGDARRRPDQTAGARGIFG